MLPILLCNVATNVVGTMAKCPQSLTDNPIEKRVLHRVNVKDGNCILLNYGTFLGTIGNLSFGGLFVTSVKQVKVMDRITVSIVLPSKFGEKYFDADVTATRVENWGLAFKYDPLGS